MHELSIAMGIVNIAEEETRKAQARVVERIELEIGALAGIELESLYFVWPSAVKGTVLEKAERRIHQIEGQGRCIDCGRVFELDQLYDACPDCGSNYSDIVQGREVRVKTLEVS